LFRHIFAVAGTLRVPLSQLQKRHIQPERYTTFFCPNFPQNQVQTVNIYKGEFWHFLTIFCLFFIDIIIIKDILFILWIIIQ